MYTGKHVLTTEHEGSITISLRPLDIESSVTVFFGFDATDALPKAKSLRLLNWLASAVFLSCQTI